jgi:hypothetical protein
MYKACLRLYPSVTAASRAPIDTGPKNALLSGANFIVREEASRLLVEREYLVRYGISTAVRMPPPLEATHH